jgi:hypothetical protein
VGTEGSNSVTGMKLILYTGYSLVSRGRWRLRPEIGIGFNNFDITLTQAEGGLEFDDVLEDPFRSVKLSKFAGIYKINISIDRSLVSIGGESSLLLGVRTGYLYHPDDQNSWNGEHISSEIKPRVNTGGVFWEIVIGFTGRLK